MRRQLSKDFCCWCAIGGQHRIKGEVKARSAENKKSLKELDIEIGYLMEKSTLPNWNQQEKDLLLGLEKQKSSILQIEYEKAKLSSRMIWLEAGDSNCKFFHNYAKHRRNVNFIWAVKSEAGMTIKDQEGIARAAHEYFKSYYSVERNILILDQLRVVKEYP